MMAGVDMSFMILEVDGSIHNPIVLAALVLWCVLVALVACAAGVAAAHRSGHLVVRIVLLVVVTVASPAAVRLLAWCFYVLPRRGFVSVGFWGQPPMIIPLQLRSHSRPAATSSFAAAHRRRPSMHEVSASSCPRRVCASAACGRSPR